MRTTLAALAGAGAAFASLAPDSYEQPPPAYGDDVSSSSSSYAISSSTLVDATEPTPDFPACWSSCFKEAGVSSPEDTCDNDDVTDCIDESCSSDEASAYKSWLAGECGAASSSSYIAGPTGSMTMSHGPSGYPTSSSLSGYPHGPSSYKPSGYPSGKPSGYPSVYPSSSGMPGGYGNCTTTYSSVCTETETLIYRDSTEYEPTTITHIFTTSLPGASCSNVPYPVTSSSSVPAIPTYGGSDSSMPASPETPESSGAAPPPYGGSESSTESSPEQPTESASEGLPEEPTVYPVDNPQSSTEGSPEVPAETPTGGYGGHTVVTDYTTVYTTVCPVTETSTEGDAEVTSVYDTTSAVTEVYTTTMVVTDGPSDVPIGGAGSPTPAPSAPAELPVCFTSCFSDNGVASQEAACDNAAVDACIKESCSADEAAQYDAWVAGFCNGGSEGGNGGSPSEYTSINVVTKPFTYGDWTSFYTDFETVTLTSYVSVDESATEGSPVPTDAYTTPAGGNGGHMTTQTQVYHPTVTTAYTTVCPGTDGESTGLTTSTITTTSTIDLTFTVTTTDKPTSYPSSSTEGDGQMPPYPTASDSASSEASGYPTGGHPTGGYPTGSVSSSYPTEPETPSTKSSAVPTPSGSPEFPIPECWAKCFAKYEVTSEKDLCGDLEVETCIKAECPIDSYNAYEGWVDDYCGVATTSSGIVGPTGGSGIPHPTGTSVYPTGSGAPHPTGSGVPQPSGSGSPTGTISTSSTCALPTPTKECKRCEGQPGTDKFCGLDVNSNIYKDDGAPITCNTVELEWEITEGLISPDGVERLAILVNGQSPGPMLKASWGDEIIVHVTNNLPVENLNGTTIHWHGIHQKLTNEYDGTPSLTQCPIAPGETFTYKFRATQYGSSWYHSHFALQAYEGLYGPLVIDGPVQESISYDGEEFVALQDWRHRPLNEIYHQLELVQNGQRSSPTLDNALINGMNTYEAGGERWSMSVEKGKTYRLRVLNAAIQSTFKFYIDGHKFTVIAADFVPIEPYETNIININNGQRYDVVFTADQDVGNYWMRSDVQAPCSNVTNGLDVKAIVHYEGASDAEPASQAYTYQPECVDERPENLVPIVPWNAGQSSDEINKDVVIVPNGGNPNLFKWTLSGTAFFSQWNDPTLQSIYDDGTVPTYSGDLAIREDNLGEWIYVVIDSPIPLPHPIHLHGHDFLVLDQGFGLYDPATASLNLNNPPRRDTAIMPFQPGTVGGYLVVAFYTDNPGVWLMHWTPLLTPCHIGWHNAMGFALQIIEGLEEIKETVEYPCQLEENCESWNAYAEEYGIVVADSGI